MPNVSTAALSPTTLSPASSMRSMSRVSGGFGNCSSSAACVRMSGSGTWSVTPLRPYARRGCDQVARALLHDPFEVAGLAGDERDEVDHRGRALDGAREADCVRHVAFDELAAELGQMPGLARLPDEATGRPALGAQRPHD